MSGLLGMGGGAGGTNFGGPSTSVGDPTGNANLEATYNQLGQIAAGQGPNPAQAQYNANIQNLAKQQAGAIASTQGISPALVARMASQQGSAAMQNAAGQGAALQAQQQLGALGMQGNIANSQAQIAAALQQNANNVNGSLAQTTMQGQQGLLGGALGGVGSALGLAHGGEVQNPKLAPVNKADRFSGATLPPHLMSVASLYHPHIMAAGGAVPGKAQVQGDSQKNDQVPAMLSPKEIVLPRSITLSPDAPEKAKQFVADLLKKHGEKTGGSKEHGDFKEALKKAVMNRKKK